MDYSGEAVFNGLTQTVKSVPASLQTKWFETARLAAMMLACCAFWRRPAARGLPTARSNSTGWSCKRPAIPNLFGLRLPGSRASQPAPVQSTAAQFPRKPPAPQQVARTEPEPAKARPQPRRVTRHRRRAAATSSRQPAPSRQSRWSAGTTRQAADRIRVVCE